MNKLSALIETTAEGILAGVGSYEHIDRMIAAGMDLTTSGSVGEASLAGVNEEIATRLGAGQLSGSFWHPDAPDFLIDWSASDGFGSEQGVLLVRLALTVNLLADSVRVCFQGDEFAAASRRASAHEILSRRAAAHFDERRRS